MKLSIVTAAALATTMLAAPALAAPVTGPRVEALVGYDNVRTKIADHVDGTMDGVFYGVGIGYDLGIGANSSIGLDAEITDSDTDATLTDGPDTATLRADRDIYVGGRFTTAVNNKLALYAKAGYTNARFKERGTVGGVPFRTSDELDGVRAGLGAQYALGQNAYLGTEYRYSNYENDVTRHQVAATVGYRF